MVLFSLIAFILVSGLVHAQSVQVNDPDGGYSIYTKIADLFPSCVLDHSTLLGEFPGCVYQQTYFVGCLAKGPPEIWAVGSIEGEYVVVSCFF